MVKYVGSLEGCAVAAKKPTDDRKCAVEGCTKPMRSNGMCVGHYTRMYRGQSIKGEFRPHNQRVRSTEKLLQTRVSDEAAEILQKLAELQGISLYQLISDTLEDMAKRQKKKKKARRAG